MSNLIISLSAVDGNSPLFHVRSPRLHVETASDGGYENLYRHYVCTWGI